MPATLPALRGSVRPAAWSLEERRLPLVFLGAIAAGLAGQAALLLPRAPTGAWSGLLLVLLPVAAFAWFGRERASGWTGAAALTGSVGGCGMALGHRLVSPPGAALEFCAVPDSGLPALLLPFFGWSSVPMLIACVACCLWTCPAARPVGAWRSWCRHGFCLAAMSFGMIVAGGLLRALGRTTVATMIPMHATMVAGMIAGAAAMHAWVYRDRRCP